MIDDIGEQLVGWGTVLRLETRGRTSGRPVEVAVGYVDEADGTLLVAAGTDDADWARNLFMDPRCVVTIGDDRRPATAEALEGAEAAGAFRELILRYGTPAERLGRGPAFRLTRESPG